LSGVFGFDGNHSRAVALAQEQAAALVTNITDDAIINARRVITEGLTDNRSLNSVARDLVGRKVGQQRVGGIIGLTEQQTDRMINIRSMMQDPERIREYFIKDRKTGKMKPRYLESDRRFDRMVRKAIKDGKALSAADVDRVTEAYRSKAGLARAKRVARNEAFTAQAAGRDEGYKQLIDSGKVEAVTKRWQHNLSVNAREDHQRMDGTVIQLGETFDFGGVRMKHPHDPAGGVEHSINCRCIAVYRTKIPKE